VLVENRFSSADWRLTPKAEMSAFVVVIVKKDVQGRRRAWDVRRAGCQRMKASRLAPVQEKVRLGQYGLELVDPVRPRQLPWTSHDAAVIVADCQSHIRIDEVWWFGSNHSRAKPNAGPS
jgi:hypothetical protein